LIALLVEDAAQSSMELAKQLVINHTSALWYLYALGKIQKGGEVPQLLSKWAIGNQLNTSLPARQKSFLWKIVTSDEKWIYYDNLQKGDPGQSSTSTPKHSHKGIRFFSVFGEIRKMCSIINFSNLMKQLSECYNCQLYQLNKEIQKKECKQKKRKSKSYLISRQRSATCCFRD